MRYGYEFECEKPKAERKKIYAANIENLKEDLKRMIKNLNLDWVNEEHKQDHIKRIKEKNEKLRCLELALEELR